MEIFNLGFWKKFQVWLNLLQTFKLSSIKINRTLCPFSLRFIYFWCKLNKFHNNLSNTLYFTSLTFVSAMQVTSLHLILAIDWCAASMAGKPRVFLLWPKIAWIEIVENVEAESMAKSKLYVWLRPWMPYQVCHPCVLHTLGLLYQCELCNILQQMLSQGPNVWSTDICRKIQYREILISS